MNASERKDAVSATPEVGPGAPDHAGVSVISPVRRDRTARTALAQLLLLAILVSLVFRIELRICVLTSLAEAEWAHALVAPLLVALLAWRRRAYLAAQLTAGSVWGLALILGGVAFCGVNIWPLRFGYLCEVALVPVLAGAVLAVCGWRVLRLCGPMLLVLLLSIPVGARQYASLTLRVETHTLAAASWVLDQLPGATVVQRGPDLDFVAGGRTGTVALGEPRRGAALLPTYVVLGVLVVFARVRATWQVAVLAVLAAPIALACNLIRLLSWGTVSIYGDFDPTSPWPRLIAAGVSLVLAYALFALACLMLDRIFVDEEELEGEREAEIVSAARDA